MARKFPDSSAQWGTDYPTVTVPVGIWTFQETASPIDDKIGVLDLTQNAALVYGVTGDPTGRVAIGYTTTASNQFFGTGETTFGNLVAGTPFSLWIRMRMPDNATSVRSVVGKGTVSPRWCIRFINGGRFQWFFENSGGTGSVSPTPTYDDGLYHDILLVYAPAEGANGTLHVYTEVDHVTLALSAFGWTTPGGVISAGEFRVGASGGSTQLGNASQALGSQVSYMAVWNVAISAAQWATLLASDQAGQFDVSGAGANSFTGLADTPGSFASLGEGSISAGPGIVELQGSFSSDGESFQTFNGMSILEGIVDVGGTGGFSASGESASFGSFDVLAGGDISLLGQLGLLGSFDVSGFGFMDESPDLGFFFNEASGGVMFTDDVYFPVTGGRLNQTIKSLKTGDYFVHRAAQGSVDDRGRYVSNIRGVFRIEASVQPVSGRNMQVLPDGMGQHSIEQKVIYCTKALYPRTPEHDPDIIMLPDLETGEVEPYEVYRCDRWDHWGDVHYIAYASRIVIP